jgi:hypothetical protein
VGYRIKYFIDSGDFDPDEAKEGSTEVQPGVRVSKDDMGYADELLVISYVDGSYLLMPTSFEKKFLEENILVIQHYIDEAFSTEKN